MRKILVVQFLSLGSSYKVIDLTFLFIHALLNDFGDLWQVFGQEMISDTFYIIQDDKWRKIDAIGV